MPRLTVEAPAKVNVQLRIVGRRPDGYHLLRMVMAPLAFGDTLVVSNEIPAGQMASSREWYVEDGLSLWCPNSPVPLTAEHLCVRAALAMRRATGRKESVTVRLTKRVPVAAGLGGGSSDAAAVLRALNTLWDLQWGPAALAEIGLRLGADVPFFCWGSAAWVEGIGEQIIPVGKFPTIPILLVNPNISVSTAEVYGRCAQTSAFCLTDNRPNAKRPRNFERFEDVTAGLVNDLAPVTMALVPVLSTIQERLYAIGADAVLMSGSGPTMVGFFRTAVARDGAKKELANSGWWLCSTQTCSV